MSVPHPPPHGGPRDPGLQAERTALAWNRTGMALLVNALLALRAGSSGGSVPIMAVGVLLLAACAAAIAYGAHRRHVLVTGTGSLAPPAAAIQATAVVMLAACAAGIASVWMHLQG